MKFTLTFKTPNATDAIDDESDADYDSISSMKLLVNKFVKYDEYVKIQFDTETQTAIVLPVNGLAR